MLLWRRTRISTLEEHPNLAEINSVLAYIPAIDDEQLRRFAQHWRNSPEIAVARARALSPDTPLVVEVLRLFEYITDLFVDEIEGRGPYATVSPGTTITALKAVRDAIAAAFARPALTSAEYTMLMAPWRETRAKDTSAPLDLGPHSDQVHAVLDGMATLAARCHDQDVAALFTALVRRVSPSDELRERAREEAWRAAVLTSRRRLWAMVRRQGAAEFGRWCAPCRRRDDADLTEMAQRVRDMCLDAACALLVADTIDETLVDVLTVPVRPLFDAISR